VTLPPVEDQQETQAGADELNGSKALPNEELANEAAKSRETIADLEQRIDEL
jgi:hypothetical protein